MPNRHTVSRLSGFRRITALVASCLAAWCLPQAAHADESALLALLFSTPSAQPGNTSSIEDSLAVHEVQQAPQLPGPIDLTADTDDLWQRIRNGFAMPNLNNDVVLYHQQWYQNRPELLRRIVERSRRYLHHIVEELERRGMPTELALLPMVESAYNPMALSPAQASGLWQFIPSTGKTYKLQQDWWKDQRRDIVASTNAALDYLQTIYDMHGDWQLALASYNWGEGAVKRAIEKNQARGLPTDYWSLTMPQETRNYVPKLQALKNIFSNPRLMAELKLPELLNRPYFATIETSRHIDVKTAAKLAGMPIAEFVALNPGNNRPVIKADTPLVIPADKVETFQSNLENNDQPLSHWQTYTLKSGERLDRLAPRFGISLDDLKRVNGLHGEIRIAAGSTLLVPSPTGEGNLDETPVVYRLPEISSPPAPKKGAAGHATHLAKAERPSKASAAGVQAAAKAKPPAARMVVAAKGSNAKLAAAAPKAAVKALAKQAAAKPAHAPSKVVKTGSARPA